MDKKNISNKTEYVMHGKDIDGNDFDVSVKYTRLKSCASFGGKHNR